MNNFCYRGPTHPASFTLILEGFLSILSGCLHIVDCMLDVVLYAVDHFALKIVLFGREEAAAEGGVRRTKTIVSQVKSSAI